MEVLTIVAWVIGGLAVETLFMGFLLRVRKGRFELNASKGSGSSWIETDLGRYQLDRKNGVFKAIGESGKSTSIPLQQLDGISLRRHEKASLMLEVLTGIDIFDMPRRYRDTVVWYTVSVESSAHGESVPIFVAGQYCPREFFLGHYVIKFQQWLLEAVHLSRAVDDVSRDVVAKTRAVFAAAGVELSMVH